MPSRDLGAVRGAVADLVVGDAACVARAAARLDGLGQPAWEDAINLAVGWGVVGTLREHFPAGRLSAHAQEKLRSASLALALRSTFVVHRSAEALAMLATAGIDTVAIKGVGLIAALRRNPASRTTGDLDVVVRQRDAGRARGILITAGYREINPEFKHQMASIARSRQLHNFARALERDGFEVDLHWQFGPTPPFALDADRLIERSIEATLRSQVSRVADPVDGVLINAHHALRGSFTPHNTVRDLCDLKLWWDAASLEARVDELCELARKSALAPTLLALWDAVLHRDPAHPLRAGRDALARLLDADERGEASQLGRFFEEQLVHGTPAHFTVEVFAPRVFLRSLVGSFPGASDGEAGVPVMRRPFLVRLAALGPRILRVLREMCRPRGIRSYRAVARAQSRFH